MRGERVIVRSFGGKPLKRRVWDVTDAVVFVTNEEEFEKLVAGKLAIEPIGFPKEDVFRDIENESSDMSIDWTLLVQWKV